jgi:hypothetical protein
MREFDTAETGGQYCRRPTFNQAKIPYPPTLERQHSIAEHSTLFQQERDACFISPRCSFHFSATVDRGTATASGTIP